MATIRIDGSIRYQISAAGKPMGAVPALAKLVRHTVDRQGYALVRGFDTHQGERAISAFTHPEVGAFGDPRADPGNGLQLIDSQAGFLPDDAPRSRDATPAEVPLHTDCAHLERPNRWTFIFTRDAGPGGGAFRLCPYRADASLFDAFVGFEDRTGDVHVRSLYGRDDHGSFIRYNGDMVRTRTGDAAAIVQTIEAGLRPFSFEVDREAGDLLIIDNRRMLHGRAACEILVRGDGSIDSLKEIHAFVM